MRGKRGPSRPGGSGARARRWVVRALLAVIAGTLLWWGWGRLSADGRRLQVRRAPAVGAPISDTGGRLRILAWNIAHVRGDVEQGLLKNWAGGGPDERRTRLARMAALLREVDADVVVLNEVDFDAGWSGGVNQAEALARAAGYPVRVEQRNFDFRVPFASYAFGNAVLSRLPVQGARWVELPAHSRLEELVLGSKEGSVVRLETAHGPVSVVAVHLEFRSEETRLAAVPVLDSLRAAEPHPLILAGDFNTAPPGWPGVGEPTALGALLRRGWRSSRAQGPPGTEQLTYPTYGLRESRDWILVDPPLRVLEARVVEGAGELSDHAPVLAVVELVR